MSRKPPPKGSLVWLQLFFGSWHKSLKKEKLLNVTHESSPHFISRWPFNFWPFKGWDSEPKKSFWMSGVNIFFFHSLEGPLQVPSAGWSEWYETSATNLKSTGRHFRMNCTFLFPGIQIKQTPRQRNWEEISFLLGKSVLSFSSNSHPVNRCTLSSHWCRLFVGTFKEFPWGPGSRFKSHLALMFSQDLAYRSYSLLGSSLSNEFVHVCLHGAHMCTHMYVAVQDGAWYPLTL